MPDRIDPADTQQVRDQAPCPRATRGNADAFGLDHVHDLGDGEEVPGETQIDDGPHLTFQALAGLTLLGTYVSLRYRRAAALQQERIGFTDRVGHISPEQHVEFGDEHLPQTQIPLRIQCAVLGQVPGVVEQSPAPAFVSTTGYRGIGDLRGDLGHLGCRLQIGVRFGVAFDPRRTERNEQPGGVEHLRHRRILWTRVTDGVGEHDG